jgi:hypothetical protein
MEKKGKENQERPECLAFIYPGRYVLCNNLDIGGLI